MDDKERKIFVSYSTNWYRVAEEVTIGPKTIYLFDAVMVVDNEGKYRVVYDKHGDVTVHTINELKMQLFIEGKTIDDLPMFTVRGTGIGVLKLYREPNGDIVGMPFVSYYEPSN